MFCKVNVQRRASVLMFFGIKLRAFLSKMCKCVNYAKTDCQCKLKKWKIWCTLMVREQGCRGVAHCLMLKTASQHFLLGGFWRRLIGRRDEMQRHYMAFSRAQLQLSIIPFTGTKEFM